MAGPAPRGGGHKTHAQPPHVPGGGTMAGPSLLPPPPPAPGGGRSTEALAWAAAGVPVAGRQTALSRLLCSCPSGAGGGAEAPQVGQWLCGSGLPSLDSYPQQLRCPLHGLRPPARPPKPRPHWASPVLAHEDLSELYTDGHLPQALRGLSSVAQLTGPGVAPGVNEAGALRGWLGAVDFVQA